jgi:nucleoside-diphosphate-sugar epimerase
VDDRAIDGLSGDVDRSDGPDGGSRRRVVVFGRGQNRINFVSVHDVAALVDRVIADPDARGQTIEIGGPENLTLTQPATAIQSAGPTVAPRHVPRGALKGMSLILRPFWPERARQGAAALALDSMDLRFDPSALRARYPDIALASPSEILALLSREKTIAGRTAGQHNQA